MVDQSICEIHCLTSGLSTGGISSVGGYALILMVAAGSGGAPGSAVGVEPGAKVVGTGKELAL